MTAIFWLAKGNCPKIERFMLESRVSRLITARFPPRSRVSSRFLLGEGPRVPFPNSGCCPDFFLIAPIHHSLAPSTEGTNLFARGLAKATFLRPSSEVFRSSSSSRVDRNASLDISSNSLSSLLGLDEIRAKRTCTEFDARAAAEASGAFARRAPGHQVSRLCT